MKISSSMALASLAIMLTSCATPPPPQAFHNTDSTALVIKSLDDTTCQMVGPAASNREGNDNVLALAKALPQHLTAVVMLENYTEPQIGDQFRDRGTALFVGLRNLGYQHIVFLQGNGIANPEGLMTLAEYN
jgi:starvation-inducible outer membrane lipoprotein